jgi:hypothetical protein
VRRRTNATSRQLAIATSLILMTVMLASGCMPDSASDDSERNRFSEIPTLVPDAGSPETPTSAVEVQTVVPEFVTQLLAPGPTLDATQRVFFRNGRDLWSFAEDEALAVLPQGTQFGAYATSPHGQRAAIAIISDDESVPSETVHIIANGELGPPLTPERFTGGPDPQSSIQSLVWSRDATRIAIVYDEAALAILEIARADGGPPQIVSDVVLPDQYSHIQRVDWAVTSQGLAVLAETPAGTGSLWMVSLEGDQYEVTEATLGGKRSISDIAWLPGRGRVAFVEERTQEAPLVGGSMFTIAPDGSGRELLVSSGNFAPAAEIVQISAAPGGSSIAFTVNVPSARGEDTFHSAWIVNIDSGATTEIPLMPGFGVTDFWWMTDGLLWRAVHQGNGTGESISTYSGFEPFAIGRFNLDDGTSTIFFQSAAD